MKTKKFLSLVLALVMALSLAIPAFAADPVAVGDEYTLDVSTATVAVDDKGDADDSNDEWSITIAGAKVVMANAATKVGDDGDTATADQIAEWAATASITDWTVAVYSKDTTGKTILLTAGADDAELPTGAKPVNSKLTSMAGLTEGSKTEIKTTTEVPTINVIIPNNGNAVLNPYKMSVTFEGDTVTDQVLSATQFVQSTSNVDLKVNVNAVGKPTSGVEMASKPLTEKVVDKQVYMFLNTKVEANQNSAPASVTFPTAYDKATAALLSSEGGELSNVELKAPDSGNTSYLAFRLEGEMTAAPTVAWTSNDKVDVTLTFTFVAVAATA